MNKNHFETAELTVNRMARQYFSLIRAVVECTVVSAV